MVGDPSSLGATGAAPRAEELSPEADCGHTGCVLTKASVGATPRLRTRRTTLHTASPGREGGRLQEKPVWCCPYAPLLPARSRSLFHFSGDAQTQPPRSGVFYTPAPFTPGCSVRPGSLAQLGLSQEGREIGEQGWERCPGPAGGPNSRSESAPRPCLKVRTAAWTRLPCGHDFLVQCDSLSHQPPCPVSQERTAPSIAATRAGSLISNSRLRTRTEGERQPRTV